MAILVLGNFILPVIVPSKMTIIVTAGYIKKLTKYIILFSLKLGVNPAFFQPSPPNVRRIIVQIRGDTSHIKSPKEPPSPVVVPIFS